MLRGRKDLVSVDGMDWFMILYIISMDVFCQFIYLLERYDQSLYDFHLCSN